MFKSIEIDIRINKGYVNTGSKITIWVDEPLHKLITGMEQAKHNSEIRETDSSVYIKKQAIMSKDKGFSIYDAVTGTKGCNIGLFYSGISRGQEYYDFDVLRSGGGTYKLEDLRRVS